MFKRWFTPKWKHEQPAMRCQAIASLKLHKPEEAEVLRNMALGDASEAVRLVAAERVTDTTVLMRMLNQSRSEHESVVLSRRLLAVILGDESTKWHDQRSVLDGVENVSGFRKCLTSEYPEGLLSYLMARLPDDQAFFLSLVQSSESRHVRYLAAIRLTCPDALKRAMDSAKTKDKTVYRILKEKRDAMKSQLRAEAQQREEAEAILSDLERLSTLEADPLLPHKVNQLERRWSALQIDATSWRDRYERVKSRLDVMCAAKAEQQHEEVQQAVDQAAAARTFDEACDLLEEALLVIAQESAIKSVDTGSLDRVRETQFSRWSQASAVAQPSAEQHARWNRILQNVEDYTTSIAILKKEYDRVSTWIDELADVKPTQKEIIERILKRLSTISERLTWPLHLNRPSVATLIEENTKQAKRLLVESEQAIAALEKTLSQHVSTLKQAISSGALKEGQAALREAHRVLRELPIKQGERFQKKLRELVQQLNDLRDWQGFATLPKKRELIEKMSALIDVELEPQDLADRVKALQQAWRELGNTQSEEEKTLWEQFKTLSDTAFAPCKHYFALQQEQRDKNLQHRNALLLQLETYLKEHDWAHADWNLVMETLKVARAQWRSASPVERRVHLKTQRRFDELVAGIQAHVDEERERNTSRKRKTVEAAAELLDHDDLDTAIAEMKTLQADWKTIGVTKRGEDNALWAEFQKHANALFAQRQRRWEDQHAERAQNRERVLALTESLKRLVTEDFDTAEAGVRVQQWRDEFEQIAPLPKEEAKRLRHDFHVALRQFEKAQETAQSREEAQNLVHLQRATQLLDQFERELSVGRVPPSRVETLKTQWLALARLPGDSEAGLNARFDLAVTAGSVSDADGHSEDADEKESRSLKLRDCLLQLEIILGIESPAEEQSRRMSLQVDRLSSKLAGKNSDADVHDAAVSLVIQWCESSKLGLLPEIEPLQRRFEHAFDTLLSRLKETRSKS